MFRTLLTLTVLASLTACIGAVDTAEPPLDDTGQNVDNDGDGFTANEDCDDDDAARNPDAVEDCTNEVDDDCDGDVDFDDSDC